MAQKEEKNPINPFRLPGISMVMAAARWLVSAEDVFAAYSLSAVQLRILVAVFRLDHQGSPAHQAAVARFAGIDVMTFSKNVRVLEKGGWVVRSKDPADSRVLTVALTTQGTANFLRLLRDLQMHDETAFAAVDGVQKMRKAHVAYLREQP